MTTNYTPKPQNFKDYVGQERVKVVLDTLIKSANIRSTACPHVLFCGPAGVGKTSAAIITANMIGGKLHKANGGSINSIKDLQYYTSFLNRKDILFVDEIHRIPIKVAECLYTVMEDFRFDLILDGKPVSENIPEFTFIGATTDLGMMPTPLKARFKFVAEFDKYSLDELTTISLKIAESYNFKMPKKAAGVIAKTCRNNPRHVVSRTEWIRDYMIANDVKRIKEDTLLSVISMQGFDENGLRKIDRKYLDILNRYGPIGVKSIASKLNTDVLTVTEDIEPFLVESGLVTVTTKGRKYNG